MSVLAVLNANDVVATNQKRRYKLVVWYNVILPGKVVPPS